MTCWCWEISGSCVLVCGVLVIYSKVYVVYACGVVVALKGISPLGVLDVLGGWTHDGHGTGWVSVG